MNSRPNYREKPVEEWGMQEWEEFFVALQKEMPEGKIELSRGPSGELIAWWPKGKSFKYGKYRTDVCKEIHYYDDDGSYFLAFTVPFCLFDVSKGYQRSEVCDELCECLKRGARRHGWGDVVDKPEEFSPEEEIGTSEAVFCQTTNQNCWLAKNADGGLDMKKTAGNLRVAEEILQDAFQDHWFEH